MKRLFLFSAMLIAWAGSVEANEIVVPDIVVPTGGTATLDIQLNNDQELCRTFGFVLTLPEGITVVNGSRKLGERFNGTNVSLNCNPEDGNKYTVYAVNSTDPTDDLPIPNESGTIVTLELEADGNLEEGTVLNAMIGDAEFTLYFKDKGGIPADVSGTSFTITIGEPDDGRLKFYETSTSLPTYTAGEKADVKMFRTIRAGQWSTICLPFTLPKAKAEAVFGADVELYEFAGYTTTVDVEGDLTPTQIQVNFSRYKLENSLSSIIGGTPYLIKTSKDIDYFEVDNVKLVNTVKTVSKTDTEYVVLEGCFKGTFVKTKIPENGLFITNNQFWYSTGKTDVKAFRAWFELDAVLNQEIDLSRISMNFEDEPTGIRTVGNSQLATDRYYNLSGQRVENTKKGLYIKNNKKVVVK